VRLAATNKRLTRSNKTASGLSRIKALFSAQHIGVCNAAQPIWCGVLRRTEEDQATEQGKGHRTRRSRVQQKQAQV